MAACIRSYQKLLLSRQKMTTCIQSYSLATSVLVICDYESCGVVRDGLEV